MIGTRGVPARYGGFETAVEEVGSRLAERGHDVVVFCRTMSESEPLQDYRGMRLVHLPALRKRSLETLSHTALSVVNPALAGVNAAFVFNAANSPFLPVLRVRGIPVATHVDGLEWKREKWGPIGRRYYRIAESLAVRWSDAIIADARGIADYYRSEFSCESHHISYGAPRLTRVGSDRLAQVGLAPRGYHLVVARFERENHVLEIIQGYVASSASLPLVIVGSAPYSSEYTAAVTASADDRVKLLGAVWDQVLLDQLYANAASYLHGHSVGGTNPSLLRAAGAAAPVIALETVFNREVAGTNGRYFRDPADVSRLVEEVETDPEAFRTMGERLALDSRRYDWNDVAAAYEALACNLASVESRGRRPTGRRVRSSVE